MENFMDKLAQRLNAQEIMKANAAAEAEERNRLSEQVKAYQECLVQVQEACEKLKETSSSVEQQLRENASGLEKIVRERIEHLSGEAEEHMQEIGNESLLRIENFQWNQDSLKQLQEEVSELPAHIDEVVHRENVKVYRNVQAVVTDENAKQAEKNQEIAGGLKSRLSPILGISIAALFLSAAGLIFQLLTYFGII